MRKSLNSRKITKSPLVEFVDLPFHPVKTTAGDIRSWISTETGNRDGEDHEGFDKPKWIIVNIPNKQRNWIVANMDARERRIVYDRVNKDRLIKGNQFRNRPYTEEMAVKDGLGGLSEAVMEKMQEDHAKMYVSIEKKKDKASKKPEENSDAETLSPENQQKESQETAWSNLSSSFEDGWQQPKQQRRKKTKKNCNEESDRKGILN